MLDGSVNKNNLRGIALTDKIGVEKHQTVFFYQKMVFCCDLQCNLEVVSNMQYIFGVLATIIFSCHAWWYHLLMSRL